MSAFQPSTTLCPPRPTAATTITSTTCSLSPGIESHPILGKWWIRNYGVGPRKSVKLLTRRSSPENRYTSVKFRPTSGEAPVTDLDFSGDGALAVVGGPRVSIYGGVNRAAGTSALTRALTAGSAIQRRREGQDEGYDDELGLFEGNSKESVEKNVAENANNLDPIDADRNISTGGLLAECAAYRSDGKLIAVGTEGGVVKICDATSRSTLRTFHSAKQSRERDRKAVRSVVWMRDGKRVIAGGDDGVVRVCNLSGSGGDGMKDGAGADVTLRGHGDRVATVAVVSFRKDDYGAKKGRGTKRSHQSLAFLEESFASSSWIQMVVSGSYDHTIRVWNIEDDFEEDRCVSIMNHGDPVQALLVMPPTTDNSYNSGGCRNKKVSKLETLPLLVSAGGTTLKVWNPLNGSCLGTFATKHAKTISSLCFLDVGLDESQEDDGNKSNGKNRRHLITGGLDGLIRIHSASNHDILSGTLPFLHGMQISEPISALAMSRDASRLAIGTTAGTVIVHQRRRLVSRSSKLTQQREQRLREPRHGTYSHFTRGAHERSHHPDDYLLMHQKKQRLAEYDILLRKFRYGDALDAVLAKRQPQAVIAVIEELGKRRGLTIALSNRDEDSLDAILSFTIRFIDNPQYSSHLIGVANILCDIYGSLRGQSVVVDELFIKLRDKVAGECCVQRMLLKLLGQIDFVMAAAEVLDREEQRQQHW